MELNEQIPDGIQEPEKFGAIMTKYDIEIKNTLKERGLRVGSVYNHHPPGQ